MDSHLSPLPMHLFVHVYLISSLQCKCVYVFVYLYMGRGQGNFIYMAVSGRPNLVSLWTLGPLYFKSPLLVNL